MSSLVSCMLAKDYMEGMKIPKRLNKKPPPIGWWMSEKLDGYRAIFLTSHRQFVSRNNKTYNAPKWMTDLLPEVDLDGELYCGRDNFEQMGTVRKKNPVDEEWINIKFHIFDAPSHPGNFHERYLYLKKIFEIIQIQWATIRATLDEKFHNLECPVKIVNQFKITSIDQMNDYYKSVIRMKGEGIMLKDPESYYESKRSDFMLKYKPVYDAEAIIVGYNKGVGKYEGKLGSFVCKMILYTNGYYTVNTNEKQTFCLSGMNDETRNDYENTHPIGTIITYQYSSMTNTGIPRFPRYLRKRHDIELTDPETLQGTAIDPKYKIKRCLEIFSKIIIYETDNFKRRPFIIVSKHIESLVNDSQLKVEELIKIKGIGPSLCNTVQQILMTHTCDKYDIIMGCDNSLEIFTKIHGVGIKKAKELIGKGFKTIEDLRNYPKLKDILTNTQIKGLKYYEHLLNRIPYEEIIEHEKYLKQILKSIDNTAELTIAGSYRRKCPTSGDIDVLIKTPRVINTSIYNIFIDDLRNKGYIVETLSNGARKFMGICRYKNMFRRIDIMFTQVHQYPFAILYFTGSMEFNTRMRKYLLERRLSLNEYGLRHLDTKRLVDYTFLTEHSIFDYIRWDYVEPENR